MEKYKRLTAKCEVGIGLTETSGNIVNDYEKAVNRLAELENKIEDGTLIELPCKVGDKVYYVNEYRPTPRIEEYKVYTFTFDFKHEIVLMVENGYGFYKNQIFLTKAEAEKKLEELRGEV